MPELSIIMPLYNTEKYVKEAVQSILFQTYRDFELIIVNDASTDNSLQIVKSLKDSRIKIIENEQNKGIVYSRNKGLNAAKGQFIAAFDSDDIAMPEKFSKQIDFLKLNTDFGMVGSWTKMIDEKGNLIKSKWKLTASPKQIPSIMLFRNYFVQSSVVLRREAIPEGGYSEGFDVVEDYKMWIDVARKFKVWNIPEYLVNYRVHSLSATQKDTESLDEKDIKVFRYIYKTLEIEIDEYVASVILLIKNNSRIQKTKELEDIERFMLYILLQNDKLNRYDQKQLTKVIFNRWIKSCFKARYLYWFSIKKFLTSPLLFRYIKNI